MPTPLPAASRTVSFLGRLFYIDTSVHRPRASTEWITKVGYIPYIRHIGRPVTVADVGVGSGVMAISCASECKNLTAVYGTDLYKNALSAASRNARSLQADAKVRLLQGDLFAPLLDQPVDIILANLPFASTAKVASIARETPEQDEPMSGIHGGGTGFELYEKMFGQLKGYQHMDEVAGMWIFCDAEHAAMVEECHQKQFGDFTLMRFEDAHKPHFRHFLFTKIAFRPGPELAQKQASSPAIKS